MNEKSKKGLRIMHFAVHRCWKCPRILSVSHYVFICWIFTCKRSYERLRKMYHLNIPLLNLNNNRSQLSLVVTYETILSAMFHSVSQAHVSSSEPWTVKFPRSDGIASFNIVLSHFLFPNGLSAVYLLVISGCDHPSRNVVVSCPSWFFLFLTLRKQNCSILS